MRSISREERFWIAAVVAVSGVLFILIPGSAGILSLLGILAMVFSIPKREKMEFIDLSAVKEK